MDYHTQRNNKINPHGTCNVTSYVMAAKRAGCLWNTPANVQAEDYFAQFLLKKKSLDYLKTIAKWAFTLNGKLKINPYEVHALLTWGYNNLANDKGYAVFSTNVTIERIVLNVLNGWGVVVSGDFPHYERGKIAHMISIAEVDYTGEFPKTQKDLNLKNLKGFVIDDPYGDYHKKYNPAEKGYADGDCVFMNYDDAKKIFRNKTETTGYWAHTIRKKNYNSKI